MIEVDISRRTAGAKGRPRRGARRVAGEQPGAARSGSSGGPEPYLEPKSWVKYGVPFAAYTAPTPTDLALQLTMLARCAGLFIQALTTSAPER